MADRLRRHASDLSRLSPADYLERNGLSTHLKEVIQLVIENRPAQPLEFVQDFQNATRSCTPLTKSFRSLRYTDISCDAFMDNLTDAYTTLTSGEGQTELVGRQYLKLIRSLCYDFPEELLASVLQVLRVEDDAIVDFKAFASGVRACLLYEEFLIQAEDHFVTTADGRTQRLTWNQISDWLVHLRRTNTDIRIPTESELQKQFGNASPETVWEGLTFNQFALLVFQLCDGAAVTRCV